MDIKIPIKLHNRFDFVYVNPETDEETQIAYAENIMLDQFWASYLGSQWFNNINLGSGTGTLVASRTSLFTHVVSKAVDASYAGKDLANGYAYYRRRITLTETENVGVTFREVGIAYSATSSHLLTHALLKDMNGNPITITKTNLDILRVYATVYLVMPTTPAYGGKLRMAWDMSPDFTSIDWFIQCCLGIRSLYVGNIFFTEMPGPAISYTHTSHLSIAYEGYGFYGPTLISGGGVDRPNKRWIGTYRIPAASANASPEGFYGITFMWNTGGNENIVMCGMDLHGGDALFAGSVLTDEALGTGDGVANNFKTKYGQIKANPVVKVDGVAVSNYTIELSKPKTTSLYPYLRTVKQIPGNKGAGSYAGNYSPLFGWKPLNYYYYSQGEGIIIEHILYQVCDFISFVGYNGLKVSASDDLVNWDLVTSYATQNDNTRTYSIGAAFRRKHYFKIEYAAVYTNYQPMLITSPLNNLTDFNNVHFTTPPGLVTAEAVGAGDSSDTTFSLAHIPIAGTLTVKFDGTTTTDYTLNGSEITFNTAPGSGVIITADYKYSCAITIDYTTDAMVKDANHVLDVNLTLQFGEYTP